MLIELTLVFDTDDIEEPRFKVLTKEDVEKYAEDLNLDTARAMAGYQGWRVEVVDAT